jgi:hypothetical protein
MTGSPGPTAALRHRPAVEGDREFLRALYILTDQWGDEDRPVSDGIGEELEAYVDRWTPEQPGVILEDVGSGTPTPVGGAWLRTFTADDPGAGFVADDIPEVAIAIRPGYFRPRAWHRPDVRDARDGPGRGLPRGVPRRGHRQTDRARHGYSKAGVRGQPPSTAAWTPAASAT